MLDCTPSSVDGRWNYGDFWETLLNEEQLDLPEWSISRDHIGVLLLSLRTNLIPEVNKYMNIRCPFHPVLPDTINGESSQSFERRSHFLTLGYLNAVIRYIEAEIQAVYRDKLQIVIRELSRLRSLLDIIAFIIRPELAEMNDSYEEVGERYENDYDLYEQEIRKMASDISENHSSDSSMLSTSLSFSSSPSSSYSSLPSYSSISPLPSSSSFISTPPSQWEIDLTWKPFGLAPQNIQSDGSQAVKKQNHRNSNKASYAVFKDISAKFERDEIFLICRWSNTEVDTSVFSI